MILDKAPQYGYGLSKRLNDYGLLTISKGTIYPLLATMEKRGLISGKMQPSPEGPDRKYYSVTPAGQDSKKAFINEWQHLQATVQKLIDEENSL